MVALAFCGRTSELNLLIDKWQRASNVDAPDPQIVVVKAEPGVGKTRLVLEFAKWLSQHVDAPGEAGYWPDSTRIIGKNLDVNPDPQLCNYGASMPYLWWGTRVSDPASENGFTGDTIGAYQKYLLLHLTNVFMRAQMKERGWELGRVWAEAGVDLAAPEVVDKILTVAKALLATARLAGVVARDNPREAVEGAARNAALIADLRKAFQPHTVTYAKTPAVFFLDDAQFLRQDPSIAAFVETLLYTAITQNWPLLLVATHWRTEFALQAEQERAFARILHHAQNGLPGDRGSAASLPGGYLSSDRVTQIDLPPVADLSPALAQSLPGLTVEQSTAFVTRLGGNPRFLEQVVEYVTQNRRFFVDLDPSGPLSDDGLARVLDATNSRQIVDVVFQRVLAAPVGLQEAIGVTSLQGIRFGNDLALAMLGGRVANPTDTLSLGDEPYGMLSGVNGGSHSIGTFTDRIFYDVATQLRGSLPGLGGELELQSEFRDRVRSFVQDEESATRIPDEYRALLFEIAVGLFETSAVPEERLVAQKALAQLAIVELSKGALEAAAALYERILESEPHGGGWGELISRLNTWDLLGEMYRRLHWPAKAARALRRQFRETTILVPDGADIFLHASDAVSTRARYDAWQQEYPRIPPEAYPATARRLATCGLRLSELASSAYALDQRTINAEDEAFGEFAFLNRLEPVVTHETSAADQELVPAMHVLQAQVLRERAYALDGVLGQNEVERIHVEILKGEARRALDDGEVASAKELLLRALGLLETMNAEIEQVPVLADLAMLTEGESEPSAGGNYLQEVVIRVEAILAGPTFAVALMQDDRDADGNIAASRDVGHVDMPAALSDLFDHDPDAAMDRFRELRRTAANTHGNLGLRAARRADYALADVEFNKALEMHQELGDLALQADDLLNLGRLANAQRKTSLACAYWGRAAVVYKQSVRAAPTELHARAAEREFERVLSLMRETGCEIGGLTG